MVWTTLILLIPAVIAILCLRQYKKFRQDADTRVARCTASTDAIIEACDIKQEHPENTRWHYTWHYPVFSYHVKDKIYTCTDFYGSSAKRYDIGQTITCMFDPEHPEYCCTQDMIDAAEKLARFTRRVAIAALALDLAIACIIYIIWVSRAIF